MPKIIFSSWSQHWWPAIVIWVFAWVALSWLDPYLDLANLSMVLLIGSAAASLWLTPFWSIIVSTIAIVAFNWSFVPPRGSFHVDLNQHLLLLIAMVMVNGLIAMLMVLQRRAAIRSADQKIRTTLLASISHDFRTPLATIIGSASSLHDQFQQLTDTEKLKMVEVILNQSNQLNQITNNVLQIVRLDSGQLNLRKDWESAEELVGSAVKLCRQRSPKRQIDAVVEPELPLMWCDALLIVQLLENLIENAIKYSPHNEAILVSACLQENSIRCSVADRGAGIPPELAEKIFDAFQRGVHDAKSGSGIGLALCQMIATIHGGAIEVAARDGGGSVFTCVFPVKENRSSPPVEKS
mgnify:CR=1 FL=1